MKITPDFLRQYFWDIDFSKLDYGRKSQFVIARILEYGDEKAIAWMMEHFPRARIINTLEKNRELTSKSANFWAFMLNVDKEKVKCLKKSFRETRKKFWPY